LYADPQNDPYSGGRQMNSHFASKIVEKDGSWVDSKLGYNISSDISSTGGQMARGFGLAFASKKYRALGVHDERFSDHGNEVCFVTIGDASTSEGIFWETMNAAVVEQVPMAVSVWDDGYGISVPKELQTAKSSISKALSGMLKDDEQDGLHIYVGKAYDYPGLVEMYERGIKQVRKHHVPALFHIEACTQPQGHSTSGSHERYKSAERLQWEKDFDCIQQMAQWMVSAGIAEHSKLDAMMEQAKTYVQEGKDRAWKAYLQRPSLAREELSAFIERARHLDGMPLLADTLIKELKMMATVSIAEVIALGRQLFHQLALSNHDLARDVKAWLDEHYLQAEEDYHTHLYSETAASAVRVATEPAQFSDDSPIVTGYKVLNSFFDQKLEANPAIMAFGEDVGGIGGVNQGFAGMQQKYGEERVFDTGIREWSIMGQAIGLAMRGFRPIAEIQYLDYLIYGLEPLSDDLATLRYRSDGFQCAPAIIRTRGHRLEGIWHAGSPMGMIVNALRGMHICVPRNMVQAAGMYNTLLRSDDPALVIEPLNGYRLKERLPDNLDSFSIPLGLPEVLIAGEDITLVTYGSCVRVAENAIEMLDSFDISVELIDVQTLLPFDMESIIVNSLKKTNRVLFLDEDLPGGATSFMMREVLEVQGGYFYLDSQPQTLTAHAHRTPFGSDGDYFTKPNVEDVVAKIVSIMHEVAPDMYPDLG
jgi:pyruvate/2-oxoglutarate/acetoin dehydrogenase E1 component/TPP-dependent pyruvate/acetoin dehydrogenase alpha subunit